MTEQYSTTTKEEAFAYYCQGASLHKIAKIIGADRVTITSWRDKDNWKKRKTKINQDALQKLSQTLTKTRMKGIKIFTDTLKQYRTDLKLGAVEVKPRDAVVVHQHLLVLQGDEGMRDNVVTVRWLRDDEEVEEE